MKLPDNFPIKPAIFALIAILALVGVGFAVMGNNETQTPQVTQPATSEPQDVMNDSEMMNNLENSTDKKNALINDDEDTSDLYNNPGTVKLTKTLNNLLKTQAVASVISVNNIPIFQPPANPPIVNPPVNPPIEQNETEADLLEPPAQPEEEPTEPPAPPVEEPQNPPAPPVEEPQEQIEEEWDPFEDPIEIEDPDANEGDGNGEDLGDENLLNP